VDKKMKAVVKRGRREERQVNIRAPRSRSVYSLLFVKRRNRGGKQV